MNAKIVYIILSMSVITGRFELCKSMAFARTGLISASRLARMTLRSQRRSATQFLSMTERHALELAQKADTDAKKHALLQQSFDKVGMTCLVPEKQLFENITQDIRLLSKELNGIESTLTGIGAEIIVDKCEFTLDNQATFKLVRGQEHIDEPYSWPECSYALCENIRVSFYGGYIFSDEHKQTILRRLMLLAKRLNAVSFWNSATIASLHQCSAGTDWHISVEFHER